MDEQWTVSLVGFGRPSDARTSSGYAAGLAGALRAGGHLRRELSAKQVGAMDALRGALAVEWRGLWPKLSVSRRWMWSESGSEILSRRLNERIERSGDRGAFLQVGTLVRIEPRYGPHIMRTDMTIPQARRAGRFAVSRLPAKVLESAEALQRSILATASHVIAASRWTAQSLVEDCGVPADKVTVVYTGGNLVVPAEVRETRAEREILFVGTDWARKGGPLLLEAFRIVIGRFPDARLRVVGCSPAVREAGVEVEGFLDKNDATQYQRLIRCYLWASCFCLPTLFDPFPNVLIEAASVGLPAVALDNGSRREAIEEGRTGRLVGEASAEALAEALCDVLADPKRCRAMGQAAREHVREHFSWTAAVQRIGRIVQSLDWRRESASAAAGVVGAKAANA